MRTHSKLDYVSVLEACYCTSGAPEAWLEQLVSSLDGVLASKLGVGVAVAREHEGGRTIPLFAGTGAVQGIISWTAPLMEVVDEATYRRGFYPRRAVLRSASFRTGLGNPWLQIWDSALSLAGATDLLGMAGHPVPGWSFVMCLLLDPTIPPKAPLRDAMHRVRIHVEAALRMRLSARSDFTAVITPEGKIAYAVGEARASAARDSLAAHARSIEWARSSRARTDANDRIAVWRALVEGRWSLVEQTDRDGRRYYAAYENAPQARTHRGLTRQEASILEVALQGVSNKYVAYATGLSEGRISECLARAATKLGFHSRAELLRVASLIRGHSQRGRSLLRLLTASEQAVLALIWQGCSNREIALARNAAERTVANQVASILRKTGATGRKALLCLGHASAAPTPKKAMSSSSEDYLRRGHSAATPQRVAGVASRRSGAAKRR